MNHQNKTHLGLYHFITILYVILFLIANIAAVKVKEFGPWQIFDYKLGPWFLDVATLYFPLLYILNDILTEIYGFIATRKVIWSSIFFAALAMLLFYIVVNIKAVNNEETRSFDIVFSFSPIILLASITSFVIGEYFNSTILSKLKIKYAGKYFWCRALFSTLIGSTIESTLFAFIAFGRMFEMNELFSMALLLIASKVIYEFLSIPIIILLVKKIKRYEKIDNYDHNVKFSFFPF